MSRPALNQLSKVLLIALAIAFVSTSFAEARRGRAARHAPKPEQNAAASDESKAAGKPSQLGSYGDWGVYLARGEKSKICYALATPKERAPASLKRDPAYLFVSSRPGENVRQEISVTMGFPVKEDGARLEIGGSSFALVAKGANAWIKNPAEEARFVDVLKKGSKLVVKAPSVKGRVTTDSYSLAGLSQALEKIEKECP